MSVVAARPQAEPNLAGPAANSQRLLSVDVFRGVCVAGMVLVTNAGDWNHVYWPFKHADWNGLTPTDLIFPSFLFLAGVSTAYSFAVRLGRGQSSAQIARHVILRSFGLILVGLLLNCFDLLSLPDLRIPGVLQRIGLCFLCAGPLYLSVLGKPAGRRVAVLIAAMVALVAGYWALQTLVDVPGYGRGRLDAVGTLSAYLDRSAFTTGHLWHWGGPGQVWDPEGLLSTLPAIANMLLGIATGEWLRNRQTDARKLLLIAGSGAALMLAGWALDPMIPINKKIWTPSFVLLSGGFSMAALAGLYWFIDRRPRHRPLLTPILVFGSNAILGFALANVISPLFGQLKIPTPDGKFAAPNGFVYQHLLPWMSSWNASLAYATLFTLLVLGLLWPLYRRRIFLRL
jgi:predicted acyltransferase